MIQCRSFSREPELGIRVMLEIVLAVSAADRDAREDPSVRPPDETELMRRVRSLPAARPLLPRLAGELGVHLVGGAVRDVLRGERPRELDLVVEGDAADLAARLGGELRVYERFGTSTVTVDGFTYDIARARKETYPTPGALPDVAPADLATDLLRRDFTINAAAIALGGPNAGELRTAPRALEDLEAGRLRVLHEKSFEDDPTRLVRLLRYASRLGFEIEPRTRQLAEAAIGGGALASISGSRLGAELRLLAREPDPVAAVGALRDLSLDAALHPGFRLDDVDLARRALELLPADGRSDLLTLAVAGRGVPPGELAALLDRLAFEARDRDAILTAATEADLTAQTLAEAKRPSEVAAAVRSAGPEAVALAGALGPAQAAGEWLGRLRGVRLEIDGRDLIAAGVDEGPAIGRGLEAALAAKLDGRASGREAELEEALRAAGERR
jgi:tRNA nucleotidyltransferase (CCA-adding enzyme)